MYIPNKDISPNISQDVQWIQRTYIIWGPCLLDWSRGSPLLFGGHVSIGMQHPECKHWPQQPLQFCAPIVSV